MLSHHFYDIFCQMGALCKIKINLLACVLGVLITNVFAEPTKSQNGTVLSSQPQSVQSSMIELPVSGDSDDERKQSFTKALGLILTKNSANSDVLNQPEIKAALANPGRYVQRFNYVSRSVAAGKQDLFLQINFDPKAITKLLQRASKVEWVNSKPITLVWFTKDVLGSKILDNENIGDGTADILRKKAREFGMTTILPTFDLQDIGSIKVNDICSLNVDKIKSASRRYGTSVIVIGCVKPPVSKEEWSSKWLLLRDTKQDAFNFTGIGIEDVITKAMR